MEINKEIAHVTSDGVTQLKKGGLSLIILLCVTLIFVCISTAGNSWVRKDSLIRGAIESSKEYGLWRSCIENNCKKYTVTDGYLVATRAMTIFSTLSILAAFILSIIAYFVDKIRMYMVSFLAVFSALTMFIACVVYLAKNNFVNSGFEYGWTLYIAWISVGFSLASSILPVILSRYQIN